MNASEAINRVIRALASAGTAFIDAAEAFEKMMLHGSKRSTPKTLKELFEYVMEKKKDQPRPSFPRITYGNNSAPAQLPGIRRCHCWASCVRFYTAATGE